MKKKIKDLTVEECIKICKKQKACAGCPIEAAMCEDRLSWSLDKKIDEYEKEVEVEE